MLAKAVASETKANFISINISDIITSEIGESEKLLANLFQKVSNL